MIENKGNVENMMRVNTDETQRQLLEEEAKHSAFSTLKYKGKDIEYDEVITHEEIEVPEDFYENR